MPNHLFHLCGQALTRLPLSIIRLFDYSIISLLLLALAPHSLFAADIPWAPGGGVDKIKVTGDCTWEWVGDELVIKWLSGSGTMELPGKADFRALLVGGGGAGGYGAFDFGNPPGGGGGGGQVLELSNLTYEKGTYQVTVGAGGERSMVGGANGQNGQPSLLKIASTEIAHALGGGGGGSQWSFHSNLYGGGGGYAVNSLSVKFDGKRTLKQQISFTRR